MVARGSRYLDLARDDAGVVQEVGDEPGLRLDAAVDGGQPPGQRDGVGLRLAAGQYVHPAHHGRQRPAQLVGDGGHELVLEVVGRFGPFPGRLLEVQERVAGVLHALRLRAILDGKEDAFASASLVTQAAGVQAHRPPADPGEVPLHLEVVERAVFRQHFPERRPEAGEVPLPVAELEQQPALRLLRPHGEGVVVGAVGLLDPQIAVHDQEGRPHRGHDGVGVVEGALELLPAGLQGRVRPSQLEVALLQLPVEGAQLLVGGLDLLLGGLQLLVHALQLFVAGDGLLVRGLQLLEGGVVLLHDGLEGLGRLRQLVPEPCGLSASGPSL
jgi:hypothetical protein